MIRPRFRFRINPFKSSKKISKSEFSLKKISKNEKKNQLGTQFTSSHDKNMTTIYITNYQKSFVARFNSSKIIRNFKNFKISFRHQFQGQLKKSLTNSTDSKKDKNQNGFLLVEQNFTQCYVMLTLHYVTLECDN